MSHEDYLEAIVMLGGTTDVPVRSVGARLQIEALDEGLPFLEGLVADGMLHLTGLALGHIRRNAHGPRAPARRLPQPRCAPLGPAGPTTPHRAGTTTAQVACCCMREERLWDEPISPLYTAARGPPWAASEAFPA